jgi:hypothetical protein
MNIYSKACEQGPWAANHSGPRRASSLRLIVIHSAEGTSARGVASWFARPSTQASTHLAVDNVRCVRMLKDLQIPWGATGANSDGLHVELCGYAKWSKEEWLAKDRLLRRAAYKTAMWCWQYDLPARWLTVAQIKDGESKGFCTHVDVNKAFGKGSHWDPGPGFPKAAFMAHVRAYLKEITAERARRAQG